jgi:hypothetical protein
MRDATLDGSTGCTPQIADPSGGTAFYIMESTDGYWTNEI